MMIRHLLDLVRQNDKAAIDFIKLAPIELIAELFASQAERVAPGVLPEHELGIRNPDRLWRHDLIGKGILKHAILVNAGFVRKSIAPDDRLVGLNRYTCNFAQHLACRIKLLAHDA